MAEAFEVAAGVFGVVSLSIQLAESVQKVKGFCDNVKDAPPRLADLIDEIEEMSDLVKDLENEHQPTGVVVTATMQRCINSSRKAVDYFETFANELQARLKKRRFSGGLKFALRQSDIEKMLNRLERAKTLLLFAYMQYQQGIQQKQHDDVRQDIKALASGQGAVLKLVQTGHASMDVDKYIHRQQLARSRQIFRVDTPAWLSNRIWQLALGRSLSGWHFTMRTYGVVPDDSLVFQACRAGDLVGMQRLFDVGLASPFDRNECGDDLLMISVANHNLAVIQFLFKCGVTSRDRKMLSFYFWFQALHSAATTDSYIREGLKLLHEHCDNEDDIAYEKTLLGPFEPLGRQTTSCPPDQLSSLLIWQKVCYAQTPSNVRSTLPIADILAQYNPDSFAGATQLQLLASRLAREVVWSAPGYPSECLKEWIVAAINFGLDLHEGNGGHSPLLLYLSILAIDRSNFRERYETHPAFLKNGLKLWLHLLERAGVDLLAYGEEEHRLFEKYESWYNPSSSLAMWRYSDLPFPSLRFTLVYGRTPSEWNVTLLDLVEEWSRDFWQLVAAQSDEAVIQNNVVPGGWISG